MKPIRLNREHEISVTQDVHGVLQVEAASEGDLFFGMGYAQALDRSLQILLTRLVAQGRLSECLIANDETLELDRFFRRMHWAYEKVDQVSLLDAKSRSAVAAYCDGMNARLAQKVPWELKLLGYRRPEPYTVEDILLFQRLLGYISQEESQLQWERLLLEMVHAGASDAMLSELFGAEHLKNLDRDLIASAHINARLPIPASAWDFVPRPVLASNNWAVAPHRSASGGAILASDPHLETNRLPAIWQEIVLKLRNAETNRYVAGAMMPGIPGIVIGRNNDVAWGATYPFMDCADNWIEECRPDAYRHGDSWKPFVVREEVIRRKRKAPVTVRYYDTHHGVLQSEPTAPGRYLCTGWSPVMNTGARSLNTVRKLLYVQSADAALDALGQIETAWNFIAADCRGNIGYQMSGLMPKRAEGTTGLTPLPGWLPGNDWQGFHRPEALPRVRGENAAFLVTANDNLNALGQAKPINQSMAPYRARRIRELLDSKERHTVDDMIRYQHDVHSLQAEQFMAILRPTLPDTGQASILKQWACRYDTESEGATLFEMVYRALLIEVIGKQGIGAMAMERLLCDTSIHIAYYGAFDRILLEGGSAWFGDEGQEACFARIAAKVLEHADPEPWGQRNAMTMRHLLFGGKLPLFLGFDRGPFPLKGGRATPHQAQIFTVNGRTSSFVATYRMVADLAVGRLQTSLAGGSSDRRWSKFYANEVESWLQGQYKTVDLE